MAEETKNETIENESVNKNKVSEKKELIKFDFNPIKVQVKKYNLRFPIDGMF